MNLAEHLRGVTKVSLEMEVERVDEFAHKWYNAICSECHKAARKSLSECKVKIIYRFWEKQLSPKALQKAIDKILIHLDSEGVTVTEQGVHYNWDDYGAFVFELSW